MKNITTLLRVGIVSLVFVVTSNAQAFDLLNDIESAISTVAKDVNDQLQQNKGGSKGGSTSNGSALEGTALKDIYLDNVFDTTKSGNNQYPRVALTVHSEPAFHNRQFPTLNTGRQERGCWSVSAVIWKSAKKPEKVAPFNWCTPGNVAYGVPLSDVTYWALWGANLSDYKHTGNKRTNGPRPPETPVPKDVRHKRHFKENNLSPSTYNGVMFASILYHMGFDWSIKADKRVWITKFEGAYK